MYVYIQKNGCIYKNEWVHPYLTFHISTYQQQHQGVCVLKLSPADINSIVQTLLHDDQILECDDMGDDGETKYIKADWEYMVQDVGLATIPCGVCPVASQCGEGKVVSPETCPYWRAYINRL